MFWEKLLRASITGIGLAALGAGCVTNNYVVPSPIILDYQQKIPVAVGFHMPPEQRDRWYSLASGKMRTDVPVGKVALDFAEANFQNAFEDFYVERYYDRRSAKGLVIKLEKIDYAVADTIVTCALGFSFFDASDKVILRKTYAATGSEKAEGAKLLNLHKAENDIELSTAVAMSQIYQAVLADLRTMLAP